MDKLFSYARENRVIKKEIEMKKTKDSETINKIDKAEKAIMKYPLIKVKFSEHYDQADEDDASKIWQVSKEGTFNLLPAMRAQVIRQENATIVIFEDGSKGVAKCGEGEKFSRKKGLRLAYNRAVMQYLENENKRLFSEEK